MSIKGTILEDDEAIRLLLPEALITQPELAAMLRVSERTLESWRHRGQGPKYVQVTPRIIRYKPSDIHIYLKARHFNHTSEYGNV